MTGLPEDVAAQIAREATGLLPEVYRDAVQPVTREIGTALGRAVRVALAPLRVLAWSWEHAEQWLAESVERRFAERKVLPEQVRTPPPQLAAGVIRGVQAAGPETDETLREMFASLLATAMQTGHAVRAHPAFAEILAQITPDEARLLRALASRMPSPIVLSISVNSVEGIVPMAGEARFEADLLALELGITPDGELIESYLDNLARLGLIRVDTEYFQQKSLEPSSDSDASYETEQRERWVALRAYLTNYGLDAIGTALQVFESHPRTVEPFVPRLSTARDQVAIYLRLVWPTTFGSYLLSAVTEPDIVSSLAGTSIEPTDTAGQPPQTAT